MIAPEQPSFFKSFKSFIEEIPPLAIKAISDWFKISLYSSKEGPSLELYKKILEQCEVSLIASGGISSIKDLEDLKDLGCSGAIIGKALYEGKISLQELQKFI